MKPRSVVLLGALCAAGASSAISRAADVSISSPVLLMNGLATPPNVTCHFSNVGDRKVRITDGGIFLRNGGKSDLTANSCGETTGFDLKPGEICSIATTLTTFIGYRCAAKVAAHDAAQVRAAIELRDASSKVQRSAALTTGATDAPAAEFRTIASSPMFGAPTQKSAYCLISNVGSKAAQLQDFEISTSSGEKIPTVVSFCKGLGVYKIKPGQTCAVWSSTSLPVTDLRCKASVTRAADIHATLIILGEGDVVLNARPVR